MDSVENKMNFQVIDEKNFIAVDLVNMLVLHFFKEIEEDSFDKVILKVLEVIDLLDV